MHGVIPRAQHAQPGTLQTHGGDLDLLPSKIKLHPFHGQLAGAQGVGKIDGSRQRVHLHFFQILIERRQAQRHAIHTTDDRGRIRRILPTQARIVELQSAQRPTQRRLAGVSRRRLHCLLCLAGGLRIRLQTLDHSQKIEFPPLVHRRIDFQAIQRHLTQRKILVERIDFCHINAQLLPGKQRRTRRIGQTQTVQRQLTGQHQRVDTTRKLAEHRLHTAVELCRRQTQGKVCRQVCTDTRQIESVQRQVEPALPVLGKRRALAFQTQRGAIDVGGKQRLHLDVSLIRQAGDEGQAQLHTIDPVLLAMQLIVEKDLSFLDANIVKGKTRRRTGRCVVWLHPCIE